MKKSSKILLAAATIWPLIYMLLFMGLFMFAMFLRDGGPGTLWAVIIPVHLLTILLIMGLTVFYIVNVFRNDRVNKDMKVLWAVVLFMGSMVAMPIYWYLYIWRDGPQALQPNQPQLVAPDLQSTWSRQTATSAPEASYVPPPQPPDWR